MPSGMNPQVQQAYRECAEHYGFLISPCRVRTPQHKGKVEQGGVHYVKRNFLGGRTPTTLTQANVDVLVWCRTTAGQRVHGTTREQPLKRFETTERAALQPLPTTPYDLAEWKVVTVQRDCHVTFDVLRLEALLGGGMRSTAQGGQPRDALGLIAPLPLAQRGTRDATTTANEAGILGLLIELDPAETLFDLTIHRAPSPIGGGLAESGVRNQGPQRQGSQVTGRVKCIPKLLV